MKMAYVLVLILLAVIGYLWWKSRSRGQRGTSRAAALRQEYRRKANLPAETAEEDINRYIQRLQERSPGHEEEWYLEKMLYDLDRDRG